jgi:predicted transcriptional regulator
MLFRSRINLELRVARHICRGLIVTAIKGEKYMETKQAKDIMIPLSKYPHIPYWFTLRQAIVEMENSELEIDGRKSLPRVVLVFDEKYRLLGIVRRRDILRGLEPGFLENQPKSYRQKVFDINIDPNLAELSAIHWVTEVRERAERPVSDIMTRISATVNHDDHLIKVIYEMVDNDLSLIPVMEDSKVIGVVRSVDVFHEVAKLLV